jgi:hypothetical protein
MQAKEGEKMIKKDDINIMHRLADLWFGDKIDITSPKSILYKWLRWCASAFVLSLVALIIVYAKNGVLPKNAWAAVWIITLLFGTFIFVMEIVVPIIICYIEDKKVKQ